MKFFNKNFLQALVIGIILILVYKSADSIDHIIKWIGAFIGILSPVIIGAIIAFFIYKPVLKFEKIYKKCKIKFVSKKARLLSLFTIYTIIVAVIVVIVNYIGPVVGRNIRELINNIPKYTAQLEAFVNKYDLLVGFDWITQLEKFIFDFLDFSRLTKYIGVVSSIASSFLSFFISIVLSIYIILDKENIFEFFRKIKAKLFNNKPCDFIIFYGRQGINMFYSYFSGLAFDAALIGIISAIVLSFFNVPYAVLLGVIIAVGNLIPFFGAIVSNVIVYVIVSLSFGPIKALWILLFQFALGQLDANFIQPKIVGDSVGISPLLVLISVTVFGGLFGPVGMIIGAPLTAVLRIMVLDFLESKKTSE